MKKKWILYPVIAVAFLLVGFASYSIYQITHPTSLFKPSKSSKEIVRFKAKDKVVQPVSFTLESKEEIAKEEEEEIPKFDVNKVNILLMGIDKNEAREKKYGDSHRSDTMILAVMDLLEKKVDLISIPRDSYVKIAGRQVKDRVNACLSYGGGVKKDGFKVATQTVSNLFGGAPVDYYVAVDMDLVIQMVDDMGGIWFDVDVPVDVAGVRFIPKGYQKLNGLQVLDYSRHRNTPNGDIDRIQRQQRMMMAVFNQLKSIDQLKNLPALYNHFTTHVYTNLDLKQIAALGYFAKDLGSQNFNMHSVKGYFLNMNGKSYWGIDQKARQAMVQEIFGVSIPLEPNDRPPAKEQHKSGKQGTDPKPQTPQDTPVETPDTEPPKVDATPKTEPPVNPPAPVEGNNP